MKKIEFQDKEALKVYQNYILRIKQMVTGLSAADQADILMEFNSHIYEGLSQRKLEDEYSTMMGLTEKLGNPEIVLIPLVAGKQLSNSVEHPKPSNWVATLISKVFKALIYLLFSVLYICMFILIFLCIAKVFLPEKVGLWYSATGFKGFGLNLRSKIDPNVQEVLHFWFIPVFSIVSYALYLLIQFIKTKKAHFLNNLSLQTINT